jgi:hypothetical protein
LTSGDCRAPVCADDVNGDGKTLELPSGVCIEGGDCHDVSGLGYYNSDDNVCSCDTPRTWSNYDDIPAGE